MCPRGDSLLSSSRRSSPRGYEKIIPAVEQAVLGLALERAKLTSRVLQSTNLQDPSESSSSFQSENDANHSNNQSESSSSLVSENSVHHSNNNKKRKRSGGVMEKHDYHDHASDPIHQEHQGVPRRSLPPFPMVLHTLLQNVEKDGFANVLSWRPHGRAFQVHDCDRFVKDVMPLYFRQTKLSSFNRQLNLYGFRRLTKQGPDRGCYYHELFLRERPDLVNDLHRHKIKGTWVRPSVDRTTEPDFYAMSPPLCQPIQAEKKTKQVEKKNEDKDTTTTTSCCGAAIEGSSADPCHNCFACGQRYTTRPRPPPDAVVSQEQHAPPQIALPPPPPVWVAPRFFGNEEDKVLQYRNAEARLKNDQMWALATSSVPTWQSSSDDTFDVSEDEESSSVASFTCDPGLSGNNQEEHWFSDNALLADDE